MLTKHYFFIWALLACIICSLFAPTSASDAVPPITDLWNHITLITQAKIALMQGQFPLRILPLQDFPLQNPYYQFYGTSSYTIAGLVYWLITPSNPLTAYKITIAMSLFIGGFYFFRLAYLFTHSFIASIIAAVSFLMTPYCIDVVNIMHAFNEIIALCVIPACLFYSIKLLQASNLKNFLLSAFCWYLLPTIHAVTFVYSSITIAAFLFLFALQKANIRGLVRVGFAYIFGCLLAAWVLVPMLLLGKFLVISTSYNELYHVSLPSLFKPGLSIPSGVTTTLEICPAISLIYLSAVIYCIYSSLLLKKSLPAWNRSLLILFFCLIILIWSPLPFWKWMPNSIRIAQYSWRLLVQIQWIGGLITAWAIVTLAKNKLDKRHFILGIFVILVSASPWYRNIIMQKIDFSKANKFKDSEFNYFIDPTIYHHHIAKLNSKISLNADQVKSHCQQKKSTYTCDINVPKNMDMLELPVLYYPDLLDIKLNEKHIDYMAVKDKKKLNAAVFVTPAQSNKLTIRFVGNHVANLISQCSGLLWISLLVFCLFRRYIYSNSTVFDD